MSLSGPDWGYSLACSSMAEREAVNFGDIGSTPIVPAKSRARGRRGCSGLSIRAIGYEGSSPFGRANFNASLVQWQNVVPTKRASGVRFTHEVPVSCVSSQAATTTGCKPVAPKATVVRVHPYAPIHTVITQLARAAPFKRWDRGSSPRDGTNQNIPS